MSAWHGRKKEICSATAGHNTVIKEDKDIGYAKIRKRIACGCI